MAMRLSSGMDLDQGVAVAALVEQRELQPERAAPVALCHYPRLGGKYRHQCRRQLPSEGARVAVWRVEEDQIVLTTVAKCGLEEPRRGLARPPRRPARSASRFRLIAATAGRAESTSVACAAPRESASMPSAPEPANRSRTRRSCDVAEDAEQRLADAVRGGPGGPALGGGQLSAAVGAGDDAHAVAIVRGWSSVGRLPGYQRTSTAGLGRVGCGVNGGLCRGSWEITPMT